MLEQILSLSVLHPEEGPLTSSVAKGGPRALAQSVLETPTQHPRPGTLSQPPPLLAPLSSLLPVIPLLHSAAAQLLGPAVVVRVAAH